MVILALDVGDKRIGVAKSMPIGGFVFPVETIHRKNIKADLDRVCYLVKSIGAELIVCGMPVNFDGTNSVQTEKTEYFVERLKEVVSVPIELVDERCTTMQARDILIEAGYSRKERKNYIDQESATFILEDYLRQQEIKNKKV